MEIKIIITIVVKRDNYRILYTLCTYLLHLLITTKIFFRLLVFYKAPNAARHIICHTHNNIVVKYVYIMLPFKNYYNHVKPCLLLTNDLFKTHCSKLH